MKLKNLLCHENQTILGVLKVINDNAKGAAFIVDDHNILKGIITDGDIRRSLLKGENLDTPVNNITQKEYITANINDSYEDLSEKVNEKIKILPIINDNGEIVDFFEYRSELHVPVSFPHLKGNELKYVTDAFLSTWISSSGKYIQEFERNFAEFTECQYGIAVSNGTVALHLALQALGIGTEDEVIVPDLTFAATINAVLHANATPVIVDVEKDGWCIDPAEIKKAITSKTKAIIPVHLYGQPCDMDEIMDIANEYNLFVIEDCAEAHGATYNGQKVGSFGHIGCFSFFANKIVTTGEGGMCVTNDPVLNEKLQLLRDHGMSKKKKYWHEEIGFNYRMTNLQAAIGLAQMERVEEMLAERERIELEYKRFLFGNPDIKFQNRITDRIKVVWLFSVLVDEKVRDHVLDKLNKSGCDARPFFYPLSQMDIYKQYTFSNSKSQEISPKGLNLPTYIGLSTEEIKKISTIINDHMENR